MDILSALKNMQKMIEEQTKVCVCNSKTLKLIEEGIEIPPTIVFVKDDHVEDLQVLVVKDGQHERLSASGIRCALKSIKNRAELERRVYPHLFRKTTATNIRRRGGSVTEAGDYLGHVDKTTAGKHYAAKSPEQIFDIFRQRVAAV